MLNILASHIFQTNFCSQQLAVQTVSYGVLPIMQSNTIFSLINCRHFTIYLTQQKSVKIKNCQKVNNFLIQS